ncbi:hypothetical protein [Rhodococcus maanshanensis]|nr:hypothetical protein [Rhodococcus maanshanensis]
MATAKKPTRGAHLSAAVAACTVLACTALVAGLGVIVTAGGRDQRSFHLPSVMRIRDDFPRIDIVDLPTATGPLYHLVVAAISGPFGMGEAGTQIVGALFAAALAALAVWHARSVPTPYGRALAVAPLLLSVYFWQSALWMLTDDAAILFTMAALVLLERTLTTRRQVAIGVLIAAAIATRQTFVWALVPAILACLWSMRGRPWPTRVGALARLCVPGVAVLVALVTMWGGLTPPAMRGFNASTQSWTSIAFTFAVAAIFAVPVLIATMRTDVIRERARVGVAVGAVAALAASVFPSAATSFPDDSRRGGVVWAVVAQVPDVAGRSPILVILAFIGGFACTVVFFILERRTAIILASALCALAVATAPGAQLYQKYAELPIGMFAVLAIVALFADGQIRRTWPLLGLAGFQALLTIGVVVMPIVRAV